MLSLMVGLVVSGGTSWANAAPKPVLNSKQLAHLRGGVCARLLKQAQYMQHWLTPSQGATHSGRAQKKYLYQQRQNIRADQVDAFLEKLKASHDNHDVIANNKTLRGLNWRRSILMQRRAVNNGNIFVPTYFKQHDSQQQHVWQAIRSLWQREAHENSTTDGSDTSADNAASINNGIEANIEASVKSIREWLNTYAHYNINMQNMVLQAFQARLQWQALSQWDKKLRAEHFEKSSSIVLDLPFLKLHEPGSPQTTPEQVVSEQGLNRGCLNRVCLNSQAQGPRGQTRRMKLKRGLQREPRLFINQFTFTIACSFRVFASCILKLIGLYWVCQIPLGMCCVPMWFIISRACWRV